MRPSAHQKRSMPVSKRIGPTLPAPIYVVVRVASGVGGKVHLWYLLRTKRTKVRGVSVAERKDRIQTGIVPSVVVVVVVAGYIH